MRGRPRGGRAAPCGGGAVAGVGGGEDSETAAANSSAELVAFVAACPGVGMGRF
jgi:hypothetical protein